MSQDHISIKDLPNYLENNKHNSSGKSPVVGMGQIIVEKEEYNWARKIGVVTIIGIFMMTSTLIVYDSMTTKNITVTVSANNTSPKDISKILSDGGGQVISVKKNDDLSYEVKLTTKKNKSSFINWLKKNKEVKYIE